MRFWDSSALVAIFVEEARSAEVRALLQADPGVFVSVLTSVEIASALSRRERMRQLTLDQRALAEASYAIVRAAWTEIGEIRETREPAIELVKKYPLRAGDALQLAAAIKATTAELSPARLPFVTLDHDLAVAAMSEGFPVLP